jgi:hypothetical protein
MPPLRIGDLFTDAELMKLARNHAFLIFERDPRLELPENRPYREFIAEARKVQLAEVS